MYAKSRVLIYRDTTFLLVGLIQIAGRGQAHADAAGGPQMHTLLIVYETADRS